MGLALKVEHDGLGNLSADTRRLLTELVRKTAFDIEAEAKTLAPVDTGALVNSIQTVTEGEGLGDLDAAVIVGQEYGPYVEFGTIHQAAQPFLTPAVERQRQVFPAAIGAAIKKAASG